MHKVPQHTYPITMNISEKAYQIVKIIFTNTASQWKFITSGENW
jgi:hypothetical protein